MSLASLYASEYTHNAPSESDSDYSPGSSRQSTPESVRRAKAEFFREHGHPDDWLDASSNEESSESNESSPEPQALFASPEQTVHVAPRPRAIGINCPGRRGRIRRQRTWLDFCLWDCLRGVGRWTRRGMASMFDRMGLPDPSRNTGSSSGSAPQSIFASAGSNNAGGGSGSGGLFGAPAASSQPAGTGLFGATTNQPAQPASTGGSSLFGNTATTSQPAGSGAPATSQPFTSMFGPNSSISGMSLNPTSTAQPAGTSLFGSTSNAPATRPPGQSLFGGAPTTSYQSAGSLFGGTAAAGQQAQQGNGNASLFGNNILPSKPKKSIITRIPNPNAPAPQPSYFQALLEKGNKRMAEENNGLPQLQYGLQDIARKVRKIGQGGPSAGEARNGVPDHTRSQYILSASGVNVGQSLRDIEELMDTAPSARPQTQPETYDYSSMSGVKDFLGQHHRNNFEKMVQSTIDSAKADFDKMIDEQLHMQPIDWQRFRKRIDVHFGLRKPDEETDGMAGGAVPESGGFGRSSRRSRIHGASTMKQSFGLPAASKSVIGTPSASGMRQSTFGDVAEKLPADGMRPAPEDRTQRLKQDKYAGKVKDLNVARIQEKVYPVMQRFSEVEAEPSNEDTSMLINAYKALIWITGEDASKDNASDPGAIKERQYAHDYLDDRPGSTAAVAVRKRIINGSRTFLEKLFYTQLEATVNRSPREANIGGVPTAIAKAKGYVRVRAARKELGPDVEILQEINGDYCWAVLFYMLRSGLYQEAAQYIDENAGAFRQIDRKFAGYLRAFINSPEHRLTLELQTAISNEYSARSRLAPEDSIDPYRMMCYKVIGRCDLSRRSLDSITNDMMDWLWLQFALARDYNRHDELQNEAFGLLELQQSIKEIGERYFGSSSDIANAPTTFFFMQVLAGLFEKAVSDLYPHNYVSATHFAIALDFYGLLRVSSDLSNEDLLSYTTRQQPQIAFGSMVGLYTADFRTANATAAIDYLTLICLNADLTGEIGKAQRELCHQALIEVTLETREFAQLLGDIRSDGQRIKGAIEQRLRLIHLDNEKEFLKHITLVAARTAEGHSRTTDAALLYHLAEDCDKVIEVINDAVSVYLTTELGEQPARLTPLKPRNTQQATGVQPQDERLSSLSLTAIDDPVELAVSMRQLYVGHDLYRSKIKDINIEITVCLITLANARRALEQGKWDLVIDYVTNSSLLPSNAGGNLSDIRSRASSFDQMQTVLARTIGHVMLWTVVACSNQVEKLRRAEFETGAQREAIARCVQTAKDVLVFAGLIKYRLPGRVWETLAQAGQEVGAY